MSKRETKIFAIKAGMNTLDELLSILQNESFSPQQFGSINIIDAIATKILIELNDVLQYLDSIGERLAFTNDVWPDDNSQDITKLVRDRRNAACHVTSDLRSINGQGRTGFIMQIGKSPAFKLDGIQYKNTHENDIAMYFGTIRVYLNRNLVEAFLLADKIIMRSDDP